MLVSSDSPRRIHIAAALVVRPDGLTLLVRKRGTAAFMQPGGKREPGETPEAALRRELREELRFEGTPGEPVWFGQFSAPAANEPETIVEADLFVVELYGDAVPQAEIEELRWIDPAAPGATELVPLTRDHVLPAWLGRRA